MGASDLTLSTSILPATGAKTGTAIAGVAISAGQAIAFDSLTQRAVLAQANSVANANLTGLALNTAAAGQQVRYQYAGPFQSVTSLKVGKIYVLSDATPGDVMEVDDIGTGDYPTVVFIGTSATTGTMGNGPMIGGVAAAGDVT